MRKANVLINPIMNYEFFQQLLSGSMLLLTIILELKMILQNIERKCVGYVLMCFSMQQDFIIIVRLFWPQ